MSQEADTPPLVRQRNTTPYAYNVAETKEHPAYAVLPGETAELPALLDGWTLLEDEPEPVADETPAKAPSRKRAAAADTDKDGGEPR
ncbi:hypothetical protein ACFYOF_17045 [Streptomyces sp. NPDC007148]|uniref:hypothetical protein n=1 Tax=Streptomyces sp. NPDC007148 TaxID=3364775 RepID=UPI0036C881EE